MKLIFVGRDNSFNRNLARSLGSDHQLLFCLFVEPDRHLLSGRLQRIKGRIARYGLLKVADELAFHLFDKLFLRKKEKLLWEQAQQFTQPADMDCPVYAVNNIHSPQYIDMIRQAAPDIIFSVCCNVVFKPALYNIPRLGTFVLHEGITPEYKGLHTTTWALMHKKFDCIGFTLLKANSRLDGGEVLVQRRYHLHEGEGFNTWSWVAHNALMTGLYDMKAALRELEANNGFTPLNTLGRNAGYYSWIGLSAFIYLYVKNYVLPMPKGLLKLFFNQH